MFSVLKCSYYVELLDEFTKFKSVGLKLLHPMFFENKLFPWKISPFVLFLKYHYIQRLFQKYPKSIKENGIICDEKKNLKKT